MTLCFAKQKLSHHYSLPLLTADHDTVPRAESLKQTKAFTTDHTLP